MTLTSGVQSRTEDLYKAKSNIDCLNSDNENDLFLEVMACPYCNLADEIENLRQEVFENEKNLELAAKYGQNLLMENSSLKVHLESLSSDNSSLLEEKEGKFHELKMQMERMKSDYESRISSVEVELMNSKGELDSKLLEIERLSFERNSIKTELASQRVAFAETIKQRDETEDLLNEELLSVKSRLGVLEKNLLDERKRERNALTENDSLCMRLEEYGSKMKSVLYENTGLKTQIEELKVHLEEAMQNIEYLSAQNDELTNQNNAEQVQEPNQQLYISNEYLTVVEQNSEVFKSSDNKRRHSMFLSPSKASKLFDDHVEKRRPQSFAWDQDVSVENHEVNSGASVASGEIVWQEYEEDDDAECDGIEEDNFIEDGCQQSLHESLSGIDDDSKHGKSWLEEFSEAEEKHRREASFSHSKSRSLEQEVEGEENCDVTRPHTSSSTVSTFDQFDQDTVERILLDIQEIGIKLKLYLSNTLEVSHATISSTSGLKSSNSSTYTSGSNSNQCRTSDHKPASSLEGSKHYHHHHHRQHKEHSEMKEDCSEQQDSSSRSEQNHSKHQSIMEQLSLFTSSSAANTQSINSGNAYETISQRLSLLLKLMSALGDLELVQQSKTDDAASQTVAIDDHDEKGDSHDPHNVKSEYAAIEQLYSHDEFEKVTRERDDALKRMTESEERVRQLKCDLEQAIKSKAKLYDQLEELQCADLTSSVSKVPTTTTISSLSNKSTPNGKQPTTTTVTSSTASKMQKYVKSPHLIAQNSNSATTTPRNNTTTRPTKQQGSAVAKQLFGATKSSNPVMSAASTKSPAGKPVSKSYASSSEFIDLDYQSGSSIAGSPSTGSFHSISSASPLGRSKTLHLHELASYVSTKRYTQHGQYRLIADSEGTEGSDLNENEEKGNGGKKQPGTTTTTATSVPNNSTSKSLTRRLSLWNNR